MLSHYNTDDIKYTVLAYFPLLFISSLTKQIKVPSL